MKRLGAVLFLYVVTAGSAGAGHELPFYPSYYPQEIRIETLDPAGAAAGLEKNTLHAYVGRDPFGEAPVPDHVKAVESFGGYLVLTFNSALDAWRDPGARCAAAGRLIATLPRSAPGYAFHPYPVTPYHADYLAHLDRIEAAKRTPPAASPAAARPPLRLRTEGSLAGRLAPGSPATGVADAVIEAVTLDALVAPRRTSLAGWLGPPWLKEGWFHAYLLLAGSLTDRTASQSAAAIVRQLTTDAPDAGPARLDLERKLVAVLTGGCERVVLGYVTRREYYNGEFSAGIENVAADAHAGLGSEIFVRTAKLKDFPWNGWLHLGVAAPPAAAWNPIAGFTDGTGRLLWAALGDPAAFPAPRGPSWVGNRVTASAVTAVAEVPRDAVLPEAGTGLFQPVGPGRPARVKVTYRVLASTFHDGSAMTVADTLYPYSLAARWGARAARGRPATEAAVAAGAAGLLDWLAGVRFVQTDATVREFAELKFTTVVHTIEAYGRYGRPDPQQTAASAPPWSPLPWPVLVLMEEAVSRRLAAFSEEAARRLGVPWLDLARDSKLRDALAPLVDEFARRGYVPPALSGLVSEADARERWTALQRFYQTHGHFLVTNGPYRLESWSAGGAVLGVFRDFSYPLGVGAYDRYTIPHRAYIARVEARGNRLQIHADVELVQKFQREYVLVRQPLEGSDVPETPECRYVVVAADGRVTGAGTVPYAGNGLYTLDLGGAGAAGPGTVAVALFVGGNYVDPEARLLALPLAGTP
ncbi:MAG TPA: hypothetical protein VGX21_05515 [Methylomirabilota bacterium]|nr:hypothetical protein [Methylomirabilota bacterium]